MAIERIQEELRPRFVQFFAPLQAPGGMPAGWKILDIETDQGVSLVFTGPHSTFTIELERRDAARACLARTVHFNVYYSVVDRLAPERRTYDADERVLFECVVACIAAREGELALTDVTDWSARVRVREIEVSRMLAPESPRVYYMNAYVGCMIGCSFCYASHRGETSRWLEGLPRTRWGQWADVKINAAEVLRRECDNLEPGIVRMSPIITDPYQPIERKYAITRQALEVLLEKGFIPVILTRSSLILRDIELLARFPQAAVGFSIPTDDDAIRAAVEPGAESIEARLDTLRQLHDAGISTYAMLQPMLPLDPERYVEMLAPLVHAIDIRPLCEVPRLEETLRQIGRPGPLDPGWEEATYKTIRAAFEARGVVVNPENEPWAYLAPPGHRR